jgi:hypothetical protein
MKRVKLTGSQIEQVMRLRENKLSWVRVQKETGIPRRIAKRELDELQRKQSERQLESVRKEVAAQEYQAHLDLLAHFAINLVDALGIPEVITELRSADEVMTTLLSKDIFKEHELVSLRLGDSQRERRVVSMNKLVFKSLQDHTQSKVDWEALAEWKAARDSCIDKVAATKKELGTVLRGILEQKPGLKRMIDATKRTDVLSRIVGGILVNLWLNDVLGYRGEVTASIGESVLKQGSAWVDFHRKALKDTELIFDSEGAKTNVDMAKGIVEISNRAISNLRTLGLISEVKSEVDKMQDAADALETTLNPLVLRPLILNSRCDICPI